MRRQAIPLCGAIDSPVGQTGCNSLGPAGFRSRETACCDNPKSQSHSTLILPSILLPKNILIPFFGNI
jgi:hypothetical protein